MVAGAGRGLGFAVAEAFAAEGARVSIASRRETFIVESAKRIEQKAPWNILAVAADVRSVEDIEKWH